MIQPPKDNISYKFPLSNAYYGKYILLEISNYSTYKSIRVLIKEEVLGNKEPEKEVFITSLSGSTTYATHPKNYYSSLISGEKLARRNFPWLEEFVDIICEAPPKIGLSLAKILLVELINKHPPFAKEISNNGGEAFVDEVLFQENRIPKTLLTPEKICPDLEEKPKKSKLNIFKSKKTKEETVAETPDI